MFLQAQPNARHVLSRICVFNPRGDFAVFVNRREELFSEVFGPLLWECVYFTNVPHDPQVSEDLVRQWIGFMWNKT